MKTFLALIIVVLLGAIGFYFFLGKGTSAGKAGTRTSSTYVTCYKCNGAGVIKCPNPNCTNGFVDCPGECLKLSVGKWEHLDLPGCRPDLLYRKFFADDGTWKAWSSNHIGEVIEMRNGVPVDVGKCPVCGGTGHVPCSVCHGTGTVTCPVCGGKRIVPAGGATVATAAMNDSAPPQSAPGAQPDSSRPAAYPEVIKMKDGKTIIGVIVIADDDVSWIRTSGGNTIQVPTKKIVSHSIQR